MMIIRKKDLNRGFTLAEVLMSVAILASVLIGLVGLYGWNAAEQQEARIRSSVLDQMRTQMETIKGMSFGTVTTTYLAGTTVNLAGVNGVMRISASFVPRTDNRLADVRIIAGWIKNNGAIVGEGINQNGAFVFRDLNVNGLLESTYTLVNTIASRE